MDREHKEKYLEDVSKLLLFKFLSYDEKKELLNVSDIINYQAGDKIISEGEIQPYLFGVIKGTVNIIVNEKEDKNVFISSIGEGDIFGEAGIFMKVKRTADVVSTENTAILRVHRDKMLSFIKKNKNAGIQILMLIIYSLLRKLREANQEIAFERKSDATQDDIDSIIEDFVY